MPKPQSLSATEGEIWNRLIHPRIATHSLEAARYFLRLEFPPQDRDRMRELAE
jgi:hypothetical protein